MPQVHVEHCFDCASHAMTTWHVPGSYDAALSALRGELMDSSSRSVLEMTVWRVRIWCLHRS